MIMIAGHRIFIAKKGVMILKSRLYDQNTTNIENNADSTTSIRYLIEQPVQI